MSSAMTRTSSGLDTPRADDWRRFGSCLGEDPEAWFPIGTQGPARLQIEAARLICHSCPVQQDCLDWALDEGIEHGIYGGATEEERKKLGRRRKRASGNHQSKRTHCKAASHPFDAVNTGTDSRGHRYCKACRRSEQRVREDQDRLTALAETETGELVSR